MKFSGRQNPNPAARVSLGSLTIIAIAVSILVVGEVTAQSTPGGQVQEVTLAEGKPQMAEQTLRTYVTSNAAGLVVALDRQTGQTRPLTADEALRLAQGIKELVKQSTDGLVQVHRANGSVSMDLQGRFQNVIIAKKEDDGTISQACVDSVDAAAAFFEIDPELVGAARNAISRRSSSQLEVR
jgi:hypothetical protein